MRESILVALETRPDLVALVAALLTLAAALLVLAARPTLWRRLLPARQRHGKRRLSLHPVFGDLPSAKAGVKVTTDVEEGIVAVPSPPPPAAAPAPNAPFNFAMLSIERPIGSGGQGGVWLACDPQSGTRCALKQLHKGRLASLKRVGSVKPQQCQWLVEREALLACGDHPFVTTCYATFQDSHSLYFALELCTGGDLFSLLHASKSGRLGESHARFYTACVGLALRHIHDSGFLYCDIKLENVLVGADGYVKLCDFGLAKKIIDVPRQHATVASVVASLWGDERHKEARSFSKCGTDQYAPPEVVDGSGRSKAADWWALGVLLHEMLTGHSPFEGKGMNAIFAKVKDYADGGALAQSELKLDILHEARPLTDTGATFFIGLLDPNESTRFGCGQKGFNGVREHAWFKSIDWRALYRQELPAPWLPGKPLAAPGSSRSTRTSVRSIDSEGTDSASSSASSSAASSAAASPVGQHLKPAPPSLAEPNFSEEANGGEQHTDRHAEQHARKGRGDGAGEGGRGETPSSSSDTCAFDEHGCEGDGYFTDDEGADEGDESLEYAEPSEEEIHEQVAALFNAKSGVLRKRPFDAAVWAPCFEPFGPCVPHELTEALSSAAAATVEKSAQRAGSVVEKQGRVEEVRSDKQ